MPSDTQPSGPVPARNRGDVAAVHSLRALPARRTTFFQLCDLGHPLIARLLASEPPDRSACEMHCGWF